ncbi:anthranilate synthase family protein [Streptomyces albidus (ex Kaewkla and Franco 2022)]|uniref:anthranilate synthase family protein n=1 Tax=Streptomyces albidus (ex Kaewkla and Franco 2022) TaxID=722709 RepID=UPI0015EE8F86|nr:anthranilate synthase family protein [Streptomyces albidus (ex Kaewkla and Franco 2022)]
MALDTAHHLQLLNRLLGPGSPPFAVLHRPDAVGQQVEILTGDVTEVARLADLPLSEAGTAGAAGHEVLAMVPFRQITERGFACHDDKAPLLALTVREQARCPVGEVLEHLPDEPVTLTNARFDIDDEEYASIVGKVLDQEIGLGLGANFVIKRSFVADVAGCSVRTALSLFRRLLTGESGAYWTFVVHTGDRTFVGATPERHVSLFDGTVVMNPISGTFRYPPEGPRSSQVMDFLADPKETGELCMVLDEELKMMGSITEGGGRAVGPFLKEMATLAHTEYLLKGRSTRDVREILRETMFAPTVTGSPLESACRVIRDYEPQGRGYYSGVAALISRDISGGRSLDSAILLRTSEISAGRLSVAVGATLVRDSDPQSEVAETHAKARSMLRALDPLDAAAGCSAAPGLAALPEVRQALEARNRDLAAFWLDDSGDTPAVPVVPGLAGRRVLIVDAEDTFTSMLAHQLGALGLEAEVCRYDEPYRTDAYDLVVMGPGPGDPRREDDPKIAQLRSTLRQLLDTGAPFLAVCLSHQVLGTVLGFEVVRREQPNQGVQKQIDFFGRQVRMGFYNSFALRAESDEIACEGLTKPVEVSRDPLTGQVHGLRGPTFRSVQFHAESVLSPDGLSALSDMVASLLEPDHRPEKVLA